MRGACARPLRLSALPTEFRLAGANADAGAAGNVLRYQLIQAATQYPGSRNVVVYFGSGARGSHASKATSTSRSDLRTAEPCWVTAAPTRSTKPNCGKSRDGSTCRTCTANRASLSGWSCPNLRAVHRDGAEAAERVELYWVPAMLAAGLVLSEIYLSVREFRRGRIARQGLDMVTLRPARLRLRRRLLICTAPAVVIALLVAVKLISVVVAGNSAASAFANGDRNAVRVRCGGPRRCQRNRTG